MVCWVDGGGDDGASEMLRIPPQLDVECNPEYLRGN